MGIPADQVKPSAPAESSESTESDEPNGLLGMDVTAITSSEVQDRLGDVLLRAYGGERFGVTVHGGERAYIVGPKDFKRFLELERSAERRAVA